MLVERLRRRVRGMREVLRREIERAFLIGILEPQDVNGLQRIAKLFRHNHQDSALDCSCISLV